MVVVGSGVLTQLALADLASDFTADAESWRASDPGTTLVWQVAGGNLGGCLLGTGPANGTTWHFVSPASWAGDWSAYHTLKFDLAIPSRQYPDQDTAAMVEIEGANGQTMSWQGPTPLWTWTHNEVALTAGAFGVDGAVFVGIMAAVKEVRDGYFKYWDEAERKFGVPYFPNVTMGWDPSPRCNQDDVFGNFGYPFMNTIGGNTPERFKEALELTKRRLLSKPGGPRILDINCWNEWTEGSYLEPDQRHGMKYLEAVRDVFGVAPTTK